MKLEVFMATKTHIVPILGCDYSHMWLPPFSRNMPHLSSGT